MSRKRPEDLSIQEVRFLLVDKRRAWRHVRLEHYYQTGQVVPIVNDPERMDHLGRQGRLKFRNHGGPHRTWLDVFLICMEFLAVVAFVSILVNSFSVLGILNRNVSTAFRQPALAPTPMIREVILPDGHMPPDRSGNTTPNEAEIPAHLRPAWQSLANLPIPTPSSQQAIRIQIPAIGVDAPVVQGDSWEQLKKGVAQHLGTPDPGRDGNIVLSGHNDVYGEVFRYLDRLNPGDKVIMFTSQRKYTYIVTGTQMVEPTAVEVMAPTADARVTLISCHPYLVDIHRIVITAILQN